MNHLRKYDLRTVLVHALETGSEAVKDAARRLSGPKRKGPKPPAKRLRRERREAKRTERTELHSDVRLQAMARSEGKCETFIEDDTQPWDWTRCEAHAVEHDHFFGRAKDKSLFGSWMQCFTHAKAKTAWLPNRTWWLRSFRMHLRYVNLHVFDSRTIEAYTVRARKIRQHLAIEEGQHPPTPSLRSAKERAE